MNFPSIGFCSYHSFFFKKRNKLYQSHMRAYCQLKFSATNILVGTTLVFCSGHFIYLLAFSDVQISANLKETRGFLGSRTAVGWGNRERNRNILPLSKEKRNGKQFPGCFPNVMIRRQFYCQHF